MATSSRGGTFTRRWCCVSAVRNAVKPTDNPLTLTLWLGIALYAAIGLFGIVIFHDAPAMTQNGSGGYGITYSAAAESISAR